MSRISKPLNPCALQGKASLDGTSRAQRAADHRDASGAALRRAHTQLSELQTSEASAPALGSRSHGHAEHASGSLAGLTLRSSSIPEESSSLSKAIPESEALEGMASSTPQPGLQLSLVTPSSSTLAEQARLL